MEDQLGQANFPARLDHADQLPLSRQQTFALNAGVIGSHAEPGVCRTYLDELPLSQGAPLPDTALWSPWADHDRQLRDDQIKTANVSSGSRTNCRSSRKPSLTSSCDSASENHGNSRTRDGAGNSSACWHGLQGRRTIHRSASGVARLRSRPLTPSCLSDGQIIEGAASYVLRPSGPIPIRVASMIIG